MNGDGLADLLVDTVQAAAGQRTVVYLVLGSAGFSSLDLAGPGSRAVRITRDAAGPGIGGADGAGDVNGDGFDDIAIGAPGAPTGAQLRTGVVDVVRGARDFAPLDLTTAGARATRILPAAGELLGIRVAGVGDVDGDGADDLAAGAASADFPGRDGAGAVTILRGGPGFFRSRTRTAAPGGGVLRLVGPFARSGVGDVGAAGDTDGDGRADVVVAGPGASLKGRGASGGA